MLQARECDGTGLGMGRRSRGCPTRVTPAAADGGCPPHALGRTVAKNVAKLDGGRAYVTSDSAGGPSPNWVRRIRCISSRGTWCGLFMAAGGALRMGLTGGLLASTAWSGRA